MDLSTLVNRIGPLVSGMEERGYSENYIARIQSLAAWISASAAEHDWASYEDVYIFLQKQGCPAYAIKEKRTYLSILHAFEADGSLPDGRHTKALFGNWAYGRLCPEFKELVDFGAARERQRGLRESSVHTRVVTASSFFCAMQDLGHETVDTIQETDVLSYFISGDMNLPAPAFSGGVVGQIRVLLKDALGWRDGACKDLLSYLPETRHTTTKNIQYLTDAEMAAIHRVRDDGNGLSRRDVAMVTMLAEYGMRASDVVGLRETSLDWVRDELHFMTQKNSVSVTLPLTTKVGNRIYAYIHYERPQVQCEHVFLTELIPYRRLQAGSLKAVTSKVFDLAQIRSNPGDQRGTHIFRHRVATSMLEKGVDRSTISALLGQDSPESIESYLHADKVHLRACTLDVSAFTTGSGETDT